ncbi:MAG: glycosyltransferase [Candidatus Omnitrophica bacterium]|nr:glycosyltransferase [Candidatus Omnitrophota bacterium]
MGDDVSVWLFWISWWFLFYAYAGYPLLLWMLARLRPAPVRADAQDTPLVSLIIAAYNEERSIARKLEETLTYDYPRDRLEVIVASDGSTDATDRIVSGYGGRGVKLVRNEPRQGKTAAQNKAVETARGHILLFSDATTKWDPDTLRMLVRNFHDAGVGCVGGEEYFLPEGGIAREAHFFWKYEKFIRRCESRIRSVIGVSGCVFGIRRELYLPLSDSLIEDFALPLAVIRSGFRCVCEPRARAYEAAAPDISAEFARKSRIVSNGMRVVWHMRALLNVVRFPLPAWQLFSHKICRWLAPVAMAVLFLSTLFGPGGSAFVAAAGIAQLIFYTFACTGFLLRLRPRTPVWIRMPYHFCLMNIAALSGLGKFFRGERKVLWEPVR